MRLFGKTPGRAAVDLASKLLAPLNLKLESTTAATAEQQRLLKLADQGWFSKPVLHLPPALQSLKWREIVAALPSHQERFETFNDPSRNDTGHHKDNEFFFPPDSEVLYTMMRLHQPKLVIETGCGNSTRVTRQAMLDGKWGGRLECIDPEPRAEVSHLADKFIPNCIEDLNPEELAARFQPGDVFFVDTSHHVRVGNDVVFIFCCVLPLLKPGVIVHIHDIFIPYEYPREWAFREGMGLWAEQYLAHALLQGDAWDVLWAGHHLSRTQPDFVKWFPRNDGRVSASLWITKR